MNYFQAREITDQDGNPAGRWHYTGMNDGRVWPAGYCSPTWNTCPDCKGWDAVPSRAGGTISSGCETCAGKGYLPVEPCPGHDTPEGAEEHQRQYMLDRRTRYDRHTPNQQHKCRVCGAWTQGFATVGESRMYILCDEHRNREEVEKLMGPVGVVISS